MMRIGEFCQIYHQKLVAGMVMQNGGWFVSLREGQIWNGPSLVGFGNTIPQAIQALCERMSNQKVVFRQGNFELHLRAMKSSSFKSLRELDLIGT